MKWTVNVYNFSEVTQRCSIWGGNKGFCFGVAVSLLRLAGAQPWHEPRLFHDRFSLLHLCVLIFPGCAICWLSSAAWVTSLIMVALFECLPEERSRCLHENHMNQTRNSWTWCNHHHVHRGAPICDENTHSFSRTRTEDTCAVRAVHYLRPDVLKDVKICYFLSPQQLVPNHSIRIYLYFLSIPASSSLSILFTLLYTHTPVTF